MFKRPQIMVLSMLRSFGKIGPQIDQIWAWLSRGHRWSPGVRNPLKSSVTGPSLLVNCYLEIKFHKIIRVNPPPPPPPLKVFRNISKYQISSEMYKNVNASIGDENNDENRIKTVVRRGDRNRWFKKIV